MSNRLYVAGIVVFWLASMSWLVTEKVLPPFFSGDAPRTGALRQDEPVAWRIDLDQSPCGEAVLQAVPGGQGVREVHSHVAVRSIPLPQALPVWLSSIATAIDTLSLETRTRTAFDGFGRLARFETRIEVNQLAFPILVNGTVVGHKLKLSLRAGDLQRRLEKPWPSGGVLAHEVLPETKLINVHPGKRWRREVFSPFSGSSEPVEILEAIVVEDVKIDYAGEFIVARQIEYRAPDRTGASDEERLRARMWVAEDGRVLKQETYLFGSRLTFTRLDEESSLAAAESRLKLGLHASMLSPEARSAGRPESAERDEGDAAPDPH